MLRAEWKKIWSRPVMWLALAAVLLAQVLGGMVLVPPGIRETAAQVNVWAGPMDEPWKAGVLDAYDRVWNGQEPSPEAYWAAAPEERAILTVVPDTEFAARLEDYVQRLKQWYAADSAFDLGKIETAYEPLRTAAQQERLRFGLSPAGSILAKQSVMAWSMVLFLLLLCSNQFAVETATAMEPLQSVSRHGRKRLFLAKLWVCLLSAALVWLLGNGVYALTLTAAAGWGVLSGTIQDFQFQSCPFVWSTGTHLLVNLAVGLAASLLLALWMFLLSGWSGTLLRAFAVNGLVFVLPMLLGRHLQMPLLGLWISNLVDNRHLWTDWITWRLGGLYVHPWTAAGAEGLLLLLGGILAVRARLTKERRVAHGSV